MKTSPPLRILAHEDYLRLRQGARVMEADRYGDKVLLLADGSYLKLFRRKRLFSSAAWYPYALRFADNTRSLAQLGIPCPEVIELYRLPQIERDAVHYRALPGETIRRMVAAGIPDDQATNLRHQIRQFIDRLHDLGIYFRSCHLGNIVLTPEGELGLIDIADLQPCRSSLGALKRQRNYRHILRDARDRDWLVVSTEWQQLQR
ncbi:toluene tolerance protein [Aromatoleum diolicum]|uniref:Toluene tolerance protein n=1 Tax=Aromatoleum diolicum TaxID=75796 RepID=A0ABX1QIA3_9RHOO|nr:toluene tolerance protein [Aromatoleum diolicum]NMG77192.1 toluene tolerance protein [Aromatoleum diolicum]